MTNERKYVSVLVQFPGGETEAYSRVAGIALVVEADDGYGLVMATILPSDQWAEALQEGAEEVRNNAMTPATDGYPND